ncbi:MAG: LytR/AlgR family response regulator transcription factor [Christensenellales bacterium]
MLLIAIVDDSPQDADLLQKQVERFFAEAKQAFVLHIYHDSVDFIRSQVEYNIAFLDIHMDKIDGLEAAHFVRKINKDTVLIFVTQMAQMAIRGYEVDALDFIIKPSDQHSINRVLRKGLARIKSQTGVSVMLKTSRGVVSISSNKIYYVEVYDHYLIYHTDQGDFRVRGQLRELHNKLSDKQFIMCSRSHLVNLRHIASVHDDYLVINGENVPISKARRKDIEQQFVNYLGENL